jgi:hypothetical protein
MEIQTMIVLAYIGFVWLAVLHTFEEIASGIFDFQVGSHTVGRRRYLFAASAISTLNLGTLVLLILDAPLGFLLGLFMTAVVGVLQGVVHTIGFIREGRRAVGLGAGFYSAIPLTLVGGTVFYLLVLNVI